MLTFFGKTQSIRTVRKIKSLVGLYRSSSNLFTIIISLIILTTYEIARVGSEHAAAPSRPFRSPQVPTQIKQRKMLNQPVFFSCFCWCHLRNFLMLRMIIFFNSRVRWQGGERPVLAVTRGVPFGCLTHWGFWCLVLCFMPLIAKSCSSMRWWHLVTTSTRTLFLEIHSLFVYHSISIRHTKQSRNSFWRHPICKLLLL